MTSTTKRRIYDEYYCLRSRAQGQHPADRDLPKAQVTAAYGITDDQLVVILAEVEVAGRNGQNEQPKEERCQPSSR